MGTAKYRRAAKCSGFGSYSRKAAKPRRSAGEKLYFVTIIWVKVQPPARIRTLPGQDVLLRQPRFVATGEFLRTASRAGFLGVYNAGGRFALGFTINQIT